MLYKSLKTHNLLKSENNVGINKEESTQINFLRSQVNLKVRMFNNGKGDF